MFGVSSGGKMKNMPNKSTHGGQREGAGPPRKMVEPVRTTITIEKAHKKQLKAKYGHNWQDKIRELISSILGDK